MEKVDPQTTAITREDAEAAGYAAYGNGQPCNAPADYGREDRRASWRIGWKKGRAMHGERDDLDGPRTLDQWRNMIPEAVCDGSPAQVLYCVTDARTTILAQSRELGRLRVALDDIARTSETVGLDGIARTARDALS